MGVGESISPGYIFVQSIPLKWFNGGLRYMGDGESLLNQGFYEYGICKVFISFGLLGKSSFWMGYRLKWKAPAAGRGFLFKLYPV